MEARIIKSERKRSNFEESLREAFETVIKTAFAEMERQKENGGGSEFTILAEVKGETGQGFKMTIDFFPPKISTIPSLN